jgi:hypothetical protein
MKKVAPGNDANGPPVVRNHRQARNLLLEEYSDGLNDLRLCCDEDGTSGHDLVDMLPKRPDVLHSFPVMAQERADVTQQVAIRKDADKFSILHDQQVVEAMAFKQRSHRSKVVVEVYEDDLATHDCGYVHCDDPASALSEPYGDTSADVRMG